MAEMITIKMPKEDMEAFLRVVEDIKFIKDAENGDREIEEGEYKTLEEVKRKNGIHE